jgi:hypothetical protein
LIDLEQLVAESSVIDVAFDGGQDFGQRQLKRDNEARHGARLYSISNVARLNLQNMQTTYPLKVQAMRSQGQQPRFYVSFPLALAAAIGLEAGETVQWELLDRGELHLIRPEAPPPSTRRRAPKN